MDLLIPQSWREVIIKKKYQRLYLVLAVSQQETVAITRVLDIRRRMRMTDTILQCSDGSDATNVDGCSSLASTYRVTCSTVLPSPKISKLKWLTKRKWRMKKSRSIDKILHGTTWASSITGRVHLKLKKNLARTPLRMLCLKGCICCSSSSSRRCVIESLSGRIDRFRRLRFLVYFVYCRSFASGWVHDFSHTSPRDPQFV